LTPAPTLRTLHPHRARAGKTVFRGVSSREAESEEDRRLKREGEQPDPGELLGRIDSLGRAPREERERLLGLIYAELRAIAGRLMRDERPDHTLQPTALVHEAFIRLVEGDVSWESRAHFFGIAARAMRQILVDHARDKKARKRGGDLTRITLSETSAEADPPGWEVLGIDQALTKLERQDPRAARVAELRAFGGLTNREAAHVLGVSQRTVAGDWTVAKLWLVREFGGAA